VLDPLLDIDLETADLGAAVSAIRLRIGDGLPGADPSLRRVPVPPSLEQELVRAMTGRDPDLGIGLPAAWALLEVRLGDRLAAGSVLVTSSDASRDLLVELVAGRAFPLPVITEAELAAIAPAGAVAAEEPHTEHVG
jgi:hypothetical protein